MTMRALVLAALLSGACNGNGNVQRRPIGSSCATSGQCGTGRYYCIVAPPGGYCSADCGKDADCPAGSVCVGAGMVLSGACKLACAGAADCRAAEGYVCTPPGSDASGSYCDLPAPAGDGGSD